MDWLSPAHTGANQAGTWLTEMHQVAKATQSCSHFTGLPLGFIRGK